MGLWLGWVWLLAGWLLEVVRVWVGAPVCAGVVGSREPGLGVVWGWLVLGVLWWVLLWWYRRGCGVCGGLLGGGKGRVKLGRGVGVDRA